MRIVVVVQARMSSTRLPGKVLLPLGGVPLLQRMLQRLEEARFADEIVVATTRYATDDPIRALAAEVGVRCVSGHPTDLLDRHMEVARVTNANAIAKIPSDCPLIDPRVVDRVLSVFRASRGQLDFATNLLPATWPDGNDVEVMRTDALEAAWREADRPYEREHTTPFIWDQPQRFRMANVTAGGWLRPDLARTHRLTLDYADDYRLIANVFKALHKEGGAAFTVEEIVDYLDANPEVRATNGRYGGAGWLDQHRHELRSAAPTPDAPPLAPAPASTLEVS